MRCPDCDGFPCLVHAKSDAEVLGIRPALEPNNVALLRNAVPPTPERAAQLIADNRTLFERATMLGGKRYPFDSVPMTRHDWQKHYQPLWGAVVSSKRHLDPDEILTPGQGIF